MRLLLALAVVAGCGGLHLAPSPRPPDGGCVPVGRWIGPRDRRAILDEVVVQRAARADVVLLGEDHDSTEHHRWQLSVLAALHAHRPSMVVGLEALPRSAQAVLDEWSAGRLDMPTLLERTAWRAYWGAEADQYVPIVHWARMYRQPLLALNVSHALVVRVGREGWPVVPISAREGVSDPAPASDAYRLELARVYAEHACRDPATVAQSAGFTRFVDAQLTWDRAMAQALADVRRDRPDALVVGIMGRGHLEHGAGVPYQLGALGVHDVMVLLPWDRERSCSELTPELGDAVFGVASPADERAAMRRARAALRPRCARRSKGQPGGRAEPDATPTSR